MKVNHIERRKRSRIWISINEKNTNVRCYKSFSLAGVCVHAGECVYVCSWLLGAQDVTFLLGAEFADMEHFFFFILFNDHRILRLRARSSLALLLSINPLDRSLGSH